MLISSRIKFGIVGHTQLPAGSRGIGVFFCLRFLFARGRRIDAVGLFRLVRTLKGGEHMTINLFFLTLTIKKRFKSLEEFEREQQIEQIYDEMKESQLKHLYLTNWR